MKKLFASTLVALVMLSTMPATTIEAVDFPVTSPFGWRVHPISGEWKFHAGVDLGFEYGAGIVALFDGDVIISTNLDDGYGNQILLYHPHLDAYTRYAHCAQLFVGVGDHVRVGEIIATVGSTGYSTGPHLHLEYIPRVGDQYIYTDPLTLWQ